MTSDEPAPRLWRIRLSAPEGAAEILEEALSGFAVSLARFEEAPEGVGADPAPLWRAEALCAGRPRRGEVAAVLAGAAARAGIAAPEFRIERVPDRDWLALNRRQFPPVAAGRFFIHGSHYDGAPPAGATVLRLDAGPAFGSGTHETTRGCLLAIDEVLRGRPVAGALDLGCGSGILALAIAAAAGAPVLASDNDPMAVATARANAAANGLGHLVTAVEGEGMGGEEIARRAPFDLVVANILAGPLIALAPDLARALAPGGRLILSGLIAGQEQAVRAAYAREGLSRFGTVALGGWSTLLLGRRGDGSAA